MAYKKYQELIVWQKSMLLAKQVYEHVKLLPASENYALSSQIRRAAISIPSNIAEGHGRFSKSEYAYFLSVARGSLYEVETQLILAHQVDYLTAEQIQPSLDLCEEIRKMLSKMITTLQ